jgi:hypothetical protein
MLDSTRFSGREMAELRRRLAAGADGAAGGDEPLLSGKELERFEEKLRSGKQL